MRGFQSSTAGDRRGQESIVLVQKLFRTAEITLGRKQTILASQLQCHRNLRKTCHFMEDLSLFSLLDQISPFDQLQNSAYSSESEIPRDPTLQTQNSNGKEKRSILANIQVNSQFCLPGTIKWFKLAQNQHKPQSLC